MRDGLTFLVWPRRAIRVWAPESHNHTSSNEVWRQIKKDRSKLVEGGTCGALWLYIGIFLAYDKRLCWRRKEFFMFFHSHLFWKSCLVKPIRGWTKHWRNSLENANGVKGPRLSFSTKLKKNVGWMIIENWMWLFQIFMLTWNQGGKSVDGSRGNDAPTTVWTWIF